jgi:cyclic-di-GMP phosphodiesterase TipF (flagellum assembly factor)
VWSLIDQGRTDAAIAAAVILLGLAQLSAVLSRLAAENRQARQNRDVVQATAAMARDIRDLGHRVGGLESHRADPAQDSGGHQLAAQIAALERTVQALAARLEVAGSLVPRKLVAKPSPPSAGDDRRSGEVALFLTPIVRLETTRTSYYRASFRSSGPGGESRFVARVVAVLRHLEQRGRAVGVFCPLAGHAFADEHFLRRLVKFLRHNDDVAGKLVIEIAQDDLAGLDRAGMKGLAWLAELGATFCLARASPEGPDLAALRDLGFQFIDIDLASLPPADPERQHLLHVLATEAERHDLTLMAGPVREAAELEWLKVSATLGHGPYFARPRRVRPDVTAPADPRSAAA